MHDLVVELEMGERAMFQKFLAVVSRDHQEELLGVSQGFQP